MRYDKDGFRIPVEGNTTLSNPHPLVLTLGGSFTYGDATYAEDTYPHLIARYLGGTTRNAGRCGYGISQMMILAKRLVPTHKPDYLIVQYSPWLIDRARNPFAPTHFGKTPTPFFYGKDELEVHPPVFATKNRDIPLDRYRGSPKDAIDFVSFLWNVGVPSLPIMISICRFTISKAF